MTEEEKKAIEILNGFRYREKTKYYNFISEEDCKCVEIVLNLIEKQQKEIERLRGITISDIQKAIDDEKEEIANILKELLESKGLLESEE